jgi:hypothetical protein
MHQLTTATGRSTFDTAVDRWLSVSAHLRRCDQHDAAIAHSAEVAANPLKWCSYCEGPLNRGWCDQCQECGL